MHAHVRQIFMAALLKDGETRPSALAWIAAVVAANELTLRAPKTPQGQQQAAAKRSGDACMVNLTAVMLQLCEPFIEPSNQKTGKGHNGYERFEVGWFDRELARRASFAPALNSFKSHTLRRALEVTAPPAGGAAAGKVAADDVAMKEAAPAAGGSAAEDELAEAIRLSLVETNNSPAAAAPAAAASSTAASAVAANADYHFVTECYFLAMGLAHVGLLPALERSQRLLEDLLRKTRLPPLPENAGSNEYAAQLTAMQNAGFGPQQAMVLAYKCHVDGEALSTLHGRYAFLTSA